MSILENVPHKVEFTYWCILLSYNLLESQEEKSCLLLYCLLGEKDTNILVKELIKYGMGLGLFEGIDVVVEARGLDPLQSRNIQFNPIDGSQSPSKI